MATVTTKAAPAVGDDKELLISGSEAVAEALALADLDVVTAYPIRPYDTVMQAVAKKIANSPLVKTAFFASDPNLGRILAAVGNAGIADLDPSRIGLQLGEVTVVENGGRSPAYTEAQGQAAMKPAEISVRVTLGRGIETATVWTCDFSYDYVKINADYRS